MSAIKGSRTNPARHDRNKKRKFYGNRHTLELETEFASTSAKKLNESMDLTVPVATNFVYCILEFASVFSAISANVICRKCKSDVTFSQCTSRGLGFKINMSCKCEESRMINSCPMIQNSYEINRYLVFEGINLFCSLMNICPGIGNSTYSAILQNIHRAASAIYETVLSFAVTQKREMNKKSDKPEDEFIVSGDGTWKKRGFSSLFGVASLIGKHCGKVVDTSVMSSFCGGCNLWKNKKNSDPIA